MLSLNLVTEFEEEVIEFPETWNELHYHDLLAIVAHLLYGEYTRQELLLKLLQDRTTLDLNELDPDTFYSNEYALSSFLEFNNLTRFVKPPSKFKCNVYPLDDFDCIRVGEFETAMQAFLKYQNAEDVNTKTKHASEICLVLFAPVDAFGKRITSLNLEQKNKLNDKIKLLPEKYKHLVVLWFIGCASVLPDYFPMTYSSGTEENAEPDHMAVTKMIHASARDKEPNARKEIRDLLLKEFLYECELTLQQLENDKQ